MTNKVSLKLSRWINLGRRGALARRALRFGHSPQASPIVPTGILVTIPGLPNQPQILLFLSLLLLSILFMLTRRKMLRLGYLHNRSYTKNSMLIKVNKRKLISNNVKERKSYNNIIKQISGLYR